MKISKALSILFLTLTCVISVSFLSLENLSGTETGFFKGIPTATAMPNGLIEYDCRGIDGNCKIVIEN